MAMSQYESELKSQLQEVQPISVCTYMQHLCSVFCLVFLFHACLKSVNANVVFVY